MSAGSIAAPTETATNGDGVIAAVWRTDPGTCAASRCSAFHLVISSPGTAKPKRIAFGTAGGESVVVPDLSVDREGGVTVIWSQTGSGLHAVYCSAARCGKDAVLDPDSSLESATTDGSGRTLAVWRTKTKRGPRLKASFGARGRFARPQVLATSGGRPAVGVSGSRFVAMWPAPGVIRAATLSGTVLGRPRTVFAEPTDAGLPVDLQVRGTTKGFVAAWHEPENDRSVRTLDLSRNGRTTASGRYALTPGRLTLLAARNGRVLVASGGNYDRTAQRCDDLTLATREAGARTFAPAVGRLPLGVSNGCGYSAAIDDLGRATVGSTGPSGAMVSLSGPTGPFAPAVAISPTVCAPETDLSTCSSGLLVSAAGTRTIATWVESGDTRLAAR